MAKVARISRAAFSARFRALIGTTPFEYLRSLRLDASAAKLEQGEPVKRVAAQSGYATSYGFSAAFGRRFGLPPGRYRRNALAAKRF
jgi:AraC-like DNA-binding protein